MGEIAARQAILHGLIAATVVEATLRVWGIRRAQSRLGFWLLALAFPFVVLPAFLIAAPFRSSDTFAAGRALFSIDRWSAVRVGGIGVDVIAVGALTLAGVLLFLRDLVPFALGTFREDREDWPERPGTPPVLTAIVREVAAESHTPAPAVVVLATNANVLYVRGLLHPTLVVSDAVVTRLAAPELRAALAHEMAHVRFRDPLAGWLLMIARLVMFWNPAVQLVARAMLQEMEHRADALAAQHAGATQFAAALHALASGASGDQSQGTTAATTRGRIELLADRFHRANVAARISAVTQPALPAPFIGTRFTLVAGTLGVLLFFVV